MQSASGAFSRLRIKSCRYVYNAVAAFGKQIQSPRSRVEILEAVVHNLADPLSGLGYGIDFQNEQGVAFQRRGLFRGGQRITMSFADAPDGGTYVTIAGEGPGRVARQFNALELDDL
jgi:hypothetical protein